MWTKVRMKVDHSTYLKKFCGQQFHAYINQKQSPVGTTCKRQDKWDPSTAMRTSVHYRQLFEPQSCTCFGPDIPVDNRAPHTDSVHAECEGVIYRLRLRTLLRAYKRDFVQIDLDRPFMRRLGIRAHRQLCRTDHICLFRFGGGAPLRNVPRPA